MFKKRKQLINPNKICFASILELTDEDLRENLLDNFRLRCTFRGNLVGKKDKDIYGNDIFLDLLDDESFSYLYFNSVSEAEEALRLNNEKKYFVMNAKPLRDIGFYHEISLDKLEKRLNNTGLYFKYMDKDQITMDEVITDEDISYIKK